MFDGVLERNKKVKIDQADVLYFSPEGEIDLGMQDPQSVLDQVSSSKHKSDEFNVMIDDNTRNIVRIEKNTIFERRKPNRT